MMYIGIAILAYFLTDTLNWWQVLCEVRRNKITRTRKFLKTLKSHRQK